MNTLLLFLSLISLPAAANDDEFIDTGEFWAEHTPSHLCSKQVLLDGHQLPEMPELFVRWNPRNAWGTTEMIDVIVQSAEEMAWLRPEADPLVVGDISRRGGGELYGHKTHRGGIDADIGIYARGGRMATGGAFQVRTPRTFDKEANWLLIRSLLETGLIDRILLDQSLIEVLREYTVEAGELTPEEALRIFPKRGTPRLWAITGVIQHAPHHADHYHVRVLCGIEE